MFRIDLERELDKRDKKGKFMKIKMVSLLSSLIKDFYLARTRRGGVKIKKL